MFAMHDFFPSDSEISSEVWIERFGLTAIFIILILLLPIPRLAKTIACVVLPALAYASTQVLGGTLFF